MKKISNVVYNDFNQMLDIYLPEGPVESTFVYFHGGGLTSCNKEHGKEFFSYPVDRGIALVSVEYRMYPTAKFPDFVEDAADSVRWVFDHAQEYGFGDRIFVGGSSAGAYLSMMLCFDPQYLAKVGLKVTDITGFIHNAGQPTCHSRILQEKGYEGKRLVVDESSAMYHVGENGTDVPPMFFLVSDDDIPNRYEQNMLMLSTMRVNGFDMEKVKLQVLHGKHCEHDFAFDENGDSVFGKLAYEYICSV